MTLEEMKEIKLQVKEVCMTRDDYYAERRKLDEGIENRLKRIETIQDWLFRAFLVTAIIGVVKLAFF